MGKKTSSYFFTKNTTIKDHKWRKSEIEQKTSRNVSHKPVTKENSHVQDQNDQG